jgi:predicted nucleic acid-binding protein
MTIREVLPDANMLIGAFDGEPGNPLHEEAYRRIMAWLDDPDVRLVTTPLILYEVLRGVRHMSSEKLETRLMGFQVFDIHKEEACQAAKVYRLAKEKRMFGLDGDEARTEERHWFNRSFDLFYCVCAEANGLEIDSQDPHIRQIQQLIQGSHQNAQA